MLPHKPNPAQKDGGPEPPPDISATIEQFARDIHDGFREPTAKRRVVIDAGIPFKEWDALPEHVKEGRREVARYVLDRWHVQRHPATPDGDPEPPPDSLPSDT